MPRLLVCGPCPLPFENVSRTYGTGIRTWQLAWSLAQSGHEVRLLALETDGAYGGDESPRAHEIRERVDILRLPYAEVMDPSLLCRRIADFSPDAVVGSTIYGSFALAQCRPRIPFWADHFGDAMAEAQAKAKLEGRNWPLAHFWRFAEPALRRADRISAVSEPQRHALVGELAALGRLTAETCGFDLTAVIPCGALPTSNRPPRDALRQGRFAGDDFLLLWSGTFNVWADVDTLFAAVAGAMDANPKVRLLLTGGAIEGHDEETYGRLQRLVEASPHRERFHFEGWIAAERLPLYEAGADLGVLSELPIYEGMLGSKNRTVRWLAEGLPVATNRIGELAESLAREGAALTFEPGDPRALRDIILWAADHPSELREIADKGQSMARQRFTFLATTRPLIAWAEAPERAPDAGLRERIHSPADFASVRFRLGKLAHRVPFLRRSPALRRLWRRWKNPGRS